MASGTITLSTPAGDIEGSIELTNAAPNKSRTLIKADLTALGAGQVVVDQRFDGTSGYVMDSLQGNHDMPGSQLDMLRNGGSFPHPFLTYTEMGTAAKLTGKEKVGEREAYLLVFEPTSGPTVRQYIDAETYLPMRSVVKFDVPQLGREVEQTIDFLDYRKSMASRCGSGSGPPRLFRTSRLRSPRWSTTSRSMKRFSRSRSA